MLATAARGLPDPAHLPTPPHGGAANTEARVVGEHDDDVADSVGELILRGETAMMGYRKRPEATAEVLRGGWRRIRELAHIDAAGTSRWSSEKMMITGDRNVSSVEVGRPGGAPRPGRWRRDPYRTRTRVQLGRGS